MSDRQKLSCYIIGADSLLSECADVLLDQGHEVRGVITATPRLVEWAGERNVPVLNPKSDWIGALRAQPFDWFFAITHLAIVPEEVLKLPQRGAINFHDGPLPRFAGLNTPAWGLIQQEPTWGITWHLMTAGIDEGDILEQRIFDLAPGETSLSLNTRNFAVAIESFHDLIGKLAVGTVDRRPQEGEKGYYGKHKRPIAAATLDLSKPAIELEAMVRGLDFGGRYPNPLGAAKLQHGDQLVIVRAAEAREDSGTPGDVLSLEGNELVIAAGEGALAITGLRTLGGTDLEVGVWAQEQGLTAGARLNAASAETLERLSGLGESLSKAEAFWSERLQTLERVELPYLSVSTAAPRFERLQLQLPAGQTTESVLAAWSIYLARLGNKDTFDLTLHDGVLSRELAGLEPWLATNVALRVNFNPDQGFEAAKAATQEELQRIQKRRTFLRDLIARVPELHANPDLRAGKMMELGIALHVDAQFTPTFPLCLALQDDGQARLIFDANALASEKAARIAHELNVLFAAALAQPQQPIAQLDLLDTAEKQRILFDYNRTDGAYRSDACIHHLFEEQAKKTPDSVAVAFENQQLTYRELNERANQLAFHLVDRGVGPGKLVGLYLERSIELMVGILGTLKAGGAYLPLDPTYPKERIAFMIMDAEAHVILTQDRLSTDMPMHSAELVRVDADWPEIAKHPRQDQRQKMAPSDISYVIYTSGSTGKPKGVMLEHRNVVNFFSGMDARIPHDPPGVWLAVTSLSFDISVLELLWTLTRGFKVVIFLDRDRTKTTASISDARGMAFGLFMWGNDAGPGKQKYELLIEGAKYFDKNGFDSVWTPERHFHAFGGPYPNAAVTGAAVAVITEKVSIRSGSVVSPLHHEIRIAEDWAIIDNLSNGRVGLSFAAGWQPNDFVIRPENYKNAKQVMVDQIDKVRRLWRGEAVEYISPLGEKVQVTTLPKPVQKELPFWVTVAGNPETYRIAGETGANLLTHLLGQSVEEVAGKIKIYREARAKAGLDPATGIVTLMLHTYVGETVEEVRNIVRQPMKDYLGASVSLVKNFAWAFPAFKRPAGKEMSPNDIDMSSLTKDEVEAILDFAFERYFETSGLFGTVDSCVQIVNRLKGIDVDEIACLLDFGMDSATVMEAFPRLAQVRDRANATVSAQMHDFSLAAQIKHHGVTHLQCTPSMARMMLMHEDTKMALGTVQHMMVGGEAFPVELARELREVVQKSVTNMYGPTETCIWSTTEPIGEVKGSIPIGRPILNTQLYVLDRRRQPVPVGVPGELYIGGTGVARGYLNRSELTAERFVADPFSGKPGARLYRTGDLVRYREDGNVEFLGRIDHQVKIRGHRIELGEIETLLSRSRGIRECVVVVREDTPGDQRLVAYFVPRAKPGPEPQQLKEDLKGKLPEYMVPAHFCQLNALPLTPNGKVDRKLLPPPEALSAESGVEFIAPSGELELKIAKIWQDTLGKDKVGIEDNFFDIGGHSLLVVKMHRMLKESLEQPISLTDLYRFPTIRSFTEFLTSDGASEAMQRSADRASKRRELLQRRRPRPRA